MVDRFSGRERQAVEMDVEANLPMVTPERERRRILASSEPLVDVQQFAAPEEPAMLQPARLH